MQQLPFMASRHDSSHNRCIAFNLLQHAYVLSKLTLSVPPSTPQSQMFSGLFVAISFIAIYISAVFMQLNASNAFSSISPIRALLAEPQMSMPNSGGDMRGFYEIGQPKDWWHWLNTKAPPPVSVTSNRFVNNCLVAGTETYF